MILGLMDPQPSDLAGRRWSLQALIFPPPSQVLLFRRESFAAAEIGDPAEQASSAFTHSVLQTPGETQNRGGTKKKNRASEMITATDLYHVLTAVVPLYVAMILAHGSVKWWKIFSPDQCSGINRFVALFAVPLLSFPFISTNDPYAMNYRFIVADTLQKDAMTGGGVSVAAAGDDSGAKEAVGG